MGRPHAGEYQQTYRHFGGQALLPVVVGPNGRINPDWVMVDDHAERHPEGAYYLDWTETSVHVSRSAAMRLLRTTVESESKENWMRSHPAKSFPITSKMTRG
ncbi:MAG TPA: hypothetical protein VNU92_17225 [Edaphobacter sp.]|nr:hypothetical protein [Edaphobacter sp.]